MKNISKVKKIENIFEDGHIHDFGEIADKTGLRLEEVVNVCKHLIKQGKIGLVIINRSLGIQKI